MSEAILCSYLVITGLVIVSAVAVKSFNWLERILT